MNNEHSLTRQEVLELLRRFDLEEQTIAERNREERQLPVEITSTLD